MLVPVRITNRPDFKGIETSLTSFEASLVGFELQIDPISRGLRLNFRMFTIFSKVLQIDPISRGLRLIKGVHFFIHFIITNRPDFKGIETTIFLASCRAYKALQIDPISRGLRHSISINLSLTILQIDPISRGLRQSFAFLIPICKAITNRPDFKGIETERLNSSPH